MTSTDSNWGERQVARRNRRRIAIAGTAVVVGVAFGFCGPYIKALGDHIAPPGRGPDAGSLLWVAGLLAAMGFLVSLGWRELDEIGRRMVVNAVAIAGITALVLLLLTMAAGKLLPAADPIHAIWLTSMLTMLAAILFQRVRG